MTYPSMQNFYHQELVDDLLLNDSIYPWDLKESDSEVYLNKIEQNLFEHFSPEEISQKADNFFLKFEQSWPLKSSINNYYVLLEEFAHFIPHEWLNSITIQVEKLINLNQNLNPMERLIKCVEPLLSEWSTIDLQVFARPFVYAMRGEISSPQELINNLITHKKWDNLSKVEKAKITLAITQYILNNDQS